MHQSEDVSWLYDEKFQPKITRRSVIYRLKPVIPSYTMPPHGVTEHQRNMFVTLEVYDDGYCELDDFNWFGIRPKRGGGYRMSEPKDVEILHAQQEVWEYLREWEYVELRRTGPEDSEHFACDKLSEDANAQAINERRWPVDPDTGI